MSKITLFIANLHSSF